MDYYEAEIERLQNRIKYIDEHPDPKRLKTNRMQYEMSLGHARKRLVDAKQGKPTSSGGGFLASTLTAALGFISTGVSPMGTREAPKYLELARNLGLPADNSCDMTVMPFAMAESGDTEQYDLEVCGQKSCTPDMLSWVFMSNMHDSHCFYIDLGFEENEANMKHVTKQLYGFIEYAEKTFPGIKYDENRLIEIQAIQEKIRGYNYEIFEMLKAVPCPIGGTDVYGGGTGGSLSTTWAAVDYAKARRDEIADRVTNKTGYLQNEKLRMLWAVTRPLYMDPFKVLAKWGIVVPVPLTGILNWSVPFPPAPYLIGRKLTPLEKVAAEAISQLWSGPASRWINAIIFLCRSLKLDAVINYNMLGCTATLGLKKLVEDAVEKELGIPTLQLEGKMWDSSYVDAATITSRLDEFAQMCLSMKGIPIR